MTQYSVVFSELMEQVFSRLEYFAGKNSSNSSEYFTFTPCKADIPLFHSLLLEAAGWIVCNLPTKAASFSLEADTLTFTFFSNAGYDKIADTTIQTVLQKAIICKTFHLWLTLTGHPQNTKWEEKALQLSQLISSKVFMHPRLRCRPLPPL